MNDDAIDNWRAKLNTRAGSMLGALILLCSGVYMCFSDLSAKGAIDLKAAFIEGKIETGSLGLMTIFFGVVIILALNLNKPYKDQEVKLIINGNEISGKGLSYRKLKELINSASFTEDVSVEQKSPNKVNPDDARTSRG